MKVMKTGILQNNLFYYHPSTRTSSNSHRETRCLFLALDDTSGRKYHKLVNNAVFIRNESLFVVSAAATSAFQLEHMPQLLRSICPADYRIRTIEYGKILVQQPEAH